MHGSADRTELGAAVEHGGRSRRASDLLDRGVPDATETAGLPPVLAAEVDHLAGRTRRWLVHRDGVHWGVQARAAAADDDIEMAVRLLEQGVHRACGAGDEWPNHGLTSAAWAASRVGGPEQLTVLAHHLHATTREFLCDGDVPLGPRSMFTGLVSAALGDLDAAVGDLDHAVAVGDERSPLWGALARYELARVLSCRAGLVASDAPAGTTGRTLTAATTFFAASGCRHLLEVATRLGRPATSWSARAEPGRGELHGDASGGWRLGFGVQPSVRAPHSLGLVAVAHLVRHGDRGVPAVEINRVLDRVAAEPDLVPAALGASTLDVWRALDLQDMADASQVQRLINDDTARSRVSKLLRRTIDSIEDRHRLLGAHLRATVRTGYVCRYESSAEVIWRL